PLEGLRVQSSSGGKLLEARRARDGDEVVHERRCRGDHETVSLWLARNDGRRLDGRDEVLRFVRQPAPAGERPEVTRAHGPDGLDDGPLSRVVSRLRQVPRTEHRVEIQEVPGRGNRGFLRVETLIQPIVHPETVPAGSRRHELPESLCTGTRRGEWVETALDH